MAAQILPYIQVFLSVVLIAGILLQQSAAGLGGAFGDNFAAGFHTRRGAEKFFFYGTVIVAILFFLSAVAGHLI
ncbi:MAG: preprotein translocase subunit SecG [bacterium]|nr:preprotein translocase subunit SecG [bacterium]